MYLEELFYQSPPLPRPHIILSLCLVASSYSNPVNNANQVNPVENTDQLYPVELYNLAESQQPQHLDFVNSFIQVNNKQLFK